MACYICATCGIQHADSNDPPASCPICQDSRQYVGPVGQQWTTLNELRRFHRLTLREEEPNLIGIGIEPHFAIGQRALLVRTPEGNVLWDCIPLVDSALVDLINGIGGVGAIAISHPHFYAALVEWSRAFGAPIYLHAADRRWVMRPDPAIEYWDSETKSILGGMTLIRCGGHFEGSSVLHWPAAAEGKGALLTGDTIQVVEDHRWVSFMYSYPNYIPLPASAIDRMEKAVQPFVFDRLYGAWWNKVVAGDAKNVIARSAERYRNALRQVDN